MKQHLLIATNGSPESLAAIEYGLWLSGCLAKPISLLGILDGHSKKRDLEEIFERVRLQVTAGHILQEEIVKGDPVQVIGQVALPSDHLLVVGPLGKPGWQRWLRGRSFRFILKEIPTPFIYVRQPHLSMNKILICMGGLGYASSVEHWALYLAHRCGAAVTLLHISEPIYFEYPTADQIRAFGDELIKSNTPQGQNLRIAVEEAHQAGVPVEVKIRQGEIIHEINAEISEGHYDLIAMGSPESSHSLRHLFMENITAQIAEKGSLPVLTARLGQEPLAFQNLE